MTTLILVLKSPFKLVCFVYPVRHFQGNLTFDFSQIMHMDRRTYTKHGPPVHMHGPPLWTYNPGQKSLGQYMLQYSYFSVISRFPLELKTVHPFQTFLVVLPRPTLYKVEKILDTRIQHCLWGDGRGSWACVNWKMPQKLMQKCPYRLLSMIVVHGSLCGPRHGLPLWATLIFEDEFC